MATGKIGAEYSRISMFSSRVENIKKQLKQNKTALSPILLCI
jgi:hypothetical protein